MQRTNKGFFTVLLTFCILFAQNSLRAQASQGDPIGDIPFTVVLDAGHGGHDPGNLGNGFLEKNIALNIVLQAGKALEGTGNVKVIYTRDDDTFVDLYKRGEIANKAQADLFVSVHCDSHSSDASGAGTFVLGLHANKQNFEVAKKENSVIYLEDNYEARYADYDISSPESVIGLTIMQEEFLDQSILLGKLMQDRFTAKLKRKDRKVKQAGFIVLHQTFMPSVLIETGFLTNKEEGNYLNSKKGQQEMGAAIADAIIEYRNTIRSNSTALTLNQGLDSGPPPPAEKEAGQPVVPVVKEAPEAVQVAEAAQTETEVSGGSVPSETGQAIEKGAKPADEAATKEAVGEGAEKAATAAGLSRAETREPVSVEKDPAAVPVEVAESGKTETGATPVALKGAADSGVAAKEEATRPNPVKEDPVSGAAREAVKPAPDSKEGLLFKVQLMAVSKDIPLTPSNFKGLNTLSKEPVNNMYRILYGNTPSYEQAKILQAGARQKGYTQAFIVAYRDGERISVEKALAHLAN
jgi:N-acetylmuramoyl-L-alanine amidase